jgi:paraquat-inducible protein A
MNPPRYPRAIDHGLAGCHTCGKVSPVAVEKCPRCGTHLHLRKPASIQNTVALMTAAAALYIPSHVLPIMTVVELGDVTHNTIIGGMIRFWKTGAYPIALVIFAASILIPLLKIVALTWLCAAATGRVNPSPEMLGKIYWFTELLGRWSMVDIFVVGILVSLVQLGNYMSITPGPGALAFAGVVMLTMFAAMSFEPRMLWDRLEEMSATPENPTTPPDT